MQIAQVLSGFSAGEADILRRAMGKKKRAELEKQRERFVNGAVKNGISKDTAIFIFKKIEPFAEYGFNKSHATAYAMIAYQTAYLKTYYSNEFIAASMSNELSNTLLWSLNLTIAKGLPFIVFFSFIDIRVPAKKHSTSSLFSKSLDDFTLYCLRISS